MPYLDDHCQAINALLRLGPSSRKSDQAHQRGHLHFALDDDDVVVRVKAVTDGGLAISAVESDGGWPGLLQRSGCGTAFYFSTMPGRLEPDLTGQEGDRQWQYNDTAKRRRSTPS